MQSPYEHPHPPPPSHAQAPNPLAGPFFLELQLQATKFCKLVANRLRIESICIAQKLVSPLTGKPALIVDHLSFPEGVKLRWFPQPNGPMLLELVVALRVHFLDYESDTRFPISFDAFFSLTTPGSKVCVTFRGTDLPQEFAAYEELLRDMLGGVDLCGALDLSPLLRFIGGSATVTKMHISATGGLNVVVVRLLVGDPSAGTEGWVKFRDSDIQPMFVGKEDWVVLLDADLLVAAAIEQISDGFASQDDVSLDQAPAASWSPAPTSIYIRDPEFVPGRYDPGKRKLLQGTISLTIEGTSHKVCDIGFSVSVVAGLEVDEPNVLKTFTRIDWSPNYWDVFWCLGPLAGLLAGGLLDIIAAAISPDLPTPSLCTRTSEHMIECEFPVNLPPLDFGASASLATFILASYRPTRKNIILAGSISLAEVIRAELSLQRSPLVWGVQGSCDHFFVGARASVIVASLPPLQTRSCQIEVIDDELAFFRPRMVIDPANSRLLPRTVSFTFELDSVSPDDPYWKDPYPLHLLVQTTAGSAVVHLGVLPRQPDGAELTALQLQLASAQARCTQTQEGLFGPSASFDFHWTVDPERDGITLWNGAITHATPGSTFELIDREGTVLGSARVGLDGNARLAAHFDASSEHPARIVRHSPVAAGSRADAINTAKAALTQRQRRFAARGVVRVIGICRSVQLEIVDRLVVMTIATTRGIEFHDVSAPDRPRLLSRLANSGVHGALAWGRGILYWGREGAWSSAGGPWVEQPIAAAERYDNLLLLLTAHGLSVHDRNLKLLHELKVEHAGKMTRAGRFLAISTRSGLTIVDLTDVKRPMIAGSLDLPPVKAIASGKVLDTTSTVIAQHERGFSLVEVGARPRVLAHYDHPPWAARTSVAGGVWARVADDGITVELYTLVETTPNLPPPTAMPG
jgi:hypothetical protein